jgi:hypothetical protein
MDQADARARACAEDEAREERDRQRRELTTRLSSPGDPARLADVSEGEVILGEVVEQSDEVLDREQLMAELEEQARLMATTVPAMTRRWVAANRKNLEDATDAELAEIVRERRAFVVGLAVKEAEAATEVPEGEPDSAPQEPQDAASGPQTPTPAVVITETDAEREARREAVEEKARQVAREQKRGGKGRSTATPPPAQGTLEGGTE